LILLTVKEKVKKLVALNLKRKQINNQRDLGIKTFAVIAVDRVVRTSVNHETLTTRGFYF
jgi:hypothetical protein